MQFISFGFSGRWSRRVSKEVHSTKEERLIQRSRAVEKGRKGQVELGIARREGRDDRPKKVSG